MSNIWLAQQYFEKSYSGWISALKGQYLEKVYVVDTEAYYNSPDYDHDIPADADDFGIVLKLGDGRSYHAIANGQDPMVLLEDGVDITTTIRVKNYLDNDDEDGLIDMPIWQPLEDIYNIEIVDVRPSFDWDERVDGVILIFPSGNLCMKCCGHLNTGVASPRYIKRIEFRKMFALMHDRLMQFSGYQADMSIHAKGRNPGEGSIFDKLANRPDISALFGRRKLGYRNNFLPSQDEISSILVELILISGAAAPEHVFDQFNWFCKECCNESPKCEDCVISPNCNYNNEDQLISYGPAHFDKPLDDS